MIVGSLFLVFIHHLVVLSHDVVLFGAEKLDLEFWQDHKQIREKFGSDTFYKASYLEELVSVDVICEITSRQVAAFLLSVGAKFLLDLVVNFSLLF